MFPWLLSMPLLYSTEEGSEDCASLAAVVPKANRKGREGEAPHLRPSCRI